HDGRARSDLRRSDQIQRLRRPPPQRPRKLHWNGASGIEGSTDARRTTIGCPAHGRSCAQPSRDRRGGLCGQRKISLGEWGNFALTVRRDAHTAFFKSFAARKAIFLLALILMASPVAGLRPIRAGRLRTCRMPRPPILMRLPFFRCLVISLIMPVSIAFT